MNPDKLVNLDAEREIEDDPLNDTAPTQSVVDGSEESVEDSVDSIKPPHVCHSLGGSSLYCSHFLLPV